MAPMSDLRSAEAEPVAAGRPGCCGSAGQAQADGRAEHADGAEPAEGVEPHDETEMFDVVIVGAGISGISAACHLQRHCPDRSYVILEGRADIGGTWDLFRYPGVRSDSDMHTLGFDFKPWKHQKSIADGPAIMDYLRETVDEYALRTRIRFGHRLHSASWSSQQRCWTVQGAHSVTGELLQARGSVLFMCAGYYSYKGGYLPELPGRDRFAGRFVHPQDWPEDLDYAGKRVAVIGSGATAMTLVPAMAADTEHITMIQRSPTYVASRPAVDKTANRLRRYLPESLAYRLTRAKNIWRQDLVYRKTRTDPEKVKDYLLGAAREAVGSDYVERHLTPSYDPWDQRLCLIPDGDLFEAINSGKASLATGTIDTITESGVLLDSGQHVDADVIIAATGLQLVTLGEMEFDIDGEPVDFSQHWTYKSMGFSDIPNLISTFGYVNASWTLKADLTSGYVCRLLNHMRSTGTDMFVPVLGDSRETLASRPWIDDVSSGYMQRSMHLLPRQGDREPWLNTQDYRADRKQIRKSPLDDGVMTFSAAPAPTAAVPAASAR